MSISVVQTAHGTGTSLSFGSATTAGNCVVVVVCDVNISSAPSVSAVTLGGNAGNFAAAATASNTGSFDALCTAWADPNCAGGQTAIAVTMSNSAHPVIIAYEISGLATSSVVDKTSTGHGTAASWSSGTTATTTQATEAWIGAACIVNTAPTGPASPWVNTSQASSTTDGIAGQQVTTSTGTATYSGTGGGSNGWAAVVITLLPSSGAITSSGGLTAGAPAMSGSAAVPVTSSGGLTAGAPAMSGTVTLPVPITASGGLTAGAPAMSGTVAMLVTASGGLRAGAPRLSGTASVLIPQLIVSLASQAGHDDYGTSFPQGIKATEGVIEGPEFLGTEFIITSAGAFFYSGTPAAGNLAISVVPGVATVTDPFGNTAEPGVTSYAGSVWGRLTAGQLAFADGSFLSSVNSVIHLETGSATAAVIMNDSLSEIDLDANSVNVNGDSLTGLFGNLDPSGLPLSGSATLAAVIAAVNSMFQRFQNMGVFQ